MKKDYQQEMEQQIAALDAPGQALLLHSCCGPCSTAVLERLAAHFSVSLYFYNPNIHTESEYQRRLDSQRRVLPGLSPTYPIRLLAAPYEPAAFAKAAAGLESQPEGGSRCNRCFTLRLEETARYAKEQGFPFFATTLSLSPRKDAERLNQIGEALGLQYGLIYLYGDFKKKNGYQRSVALSKELNLYRQTFCGCRFSLKPR